MKKTIFVFVSVLALVSCSHRNNNSSAASSEPTMGDQLLNGGVQDPSLTGGIPQSVGLQRVRFKVIDTGYVGAPVLFHWTKGTVTVRHASDEFPTHVDLNKAKPAVVDLKVPGGFLHFTGEFEGYDPYAYGNYGPDPFADCGRKEYGHYTKDVILVTYTISEGKTLVCKASVSTVPN